MRLGHTIEPRRALYPRAVASPPPRSSHKQPPPRSAATDQRCAEAKLEDENKDERAQDVRLNGQAAGGQDSGGRGGGAGSGAAGGGGGAMTADEVETWASRTLAERSSLEQTKAAARRAASGEERAGHAARLASGAHAFQPGSSFGSLSTGGGGVGGGASGQGCLPCPPPLAPLFWGLVAELCVCVAGALLLGFRELGSVLRWMGVLSKASTGLNGRSSLASPTDAELEASEPPLPTLMELWAPIQAEAYAARDAAVRAAAEDEAAAAAAEAEKEQKGAMEGLGERSADSSLDGLMKSRDVSLDGAEEKWETGSGASTVATVASAATGTKVATGGVGNTRAEKRASRHAAKLAAKEERAVARQAAKAAKQEKAAVKAAAKAEARQAAVDAREGERRLKQLERLKQSPAFKQAQARKDYDAAMAARKSPERSRPAPDDGQSRDGGSGCGQARTPPPPRPPPRDRTPTRSPPRTPRRSGGSGPHGPSGLVAPSPRRSRERYTTAAEQQPTRPSTEAIAHGRGAGHGLERGESSDDPDVFDAPEFALRGAVVGPTAGPRLAGMPRRGMSEMDSLDGSFDFASEPMQMRSPQRGPGR